MKDLKQYIQEGILDNMEDVLSKNFVPFGSKYKLISIIGDDDIIFYTGLKPLVEYSNQKSINDIKPILDYFINVYCTFTGMSISRQKLILGLLTYIDNYMLDTDKFDLNNQKDKDAFLVELSNKLKDNGLILKNVEIDNKDTLADTKDNKNKIRIFLHYKFKTFDKLDHLSIHH